MEVQDAFRIVYGVLIAVNISGNTLVCLVVYRFPFMQTPMNYLLVHLAVCDMLAGTFHFLRLGLHGSFPHPSGDTGDFLCKFVTNGNLGWLSSGASINTLVTIAWERYIAITKPHAPRLSNKKIKAAIAVCWVVSVIVCMPEFRAATYDKKRMSCGWFWDGKWEAHLSALLWLIGGLTFPFCIFVVLYGRLMRILWFSKQRVTDITQRTLIKSRKKITKATMTVTVIFFACWTPNIVYYVVVMLSPDIRTQTMSFLYLFTMLLIFINEAINPFIYARQDCRFRENMGRILCRYDRAIGSQTKTIK